MSILKIKDTQGNWVDIPAIKGDAFKYEDFTPEQLAQLKGPKGDPGLTEDEIKVIVANDAVLKSEIGEGNTIGASATHSYAFGSENTVEGSNSYAMGTKNVISSTGNTSLVVGNENTVSGIRSVSFGSLNVSSGMMSTSFGQRTQATGAAAMAIGSRSEAKGNYSLAFGGHSTNSLDPTNKHGQYWHPIAEGSGSAAIGTGCESNAASSVSMGRRTITDGVGSVALGFGAQTNRRGMVAVGIANDPDENDIFEVGYGHNPDGTEYNSDNLVPVRDNVFKVTTSGEAIAKTALGIGSTTFTESDIEAWNNKQGKPASVTSGTNITLADNTEYRLADVSTLALTYPSGNFECWMRITTVSSGTVTITLPSGTHYLGSVPTFGNGETWELSIKDGYVTSVKEVTQ